MHISDSFLSLSRRIRATPSLALSVTSLRNVNCNRSDSHPLYLNNAFLPRLVYRPHAAEAFYCSGGRRRKTDVDGCAM